MGFRFRKTFKIAPGIKFNLGKKCAGFSVGGKYGSLSINSRNGLSGRTSLYGTGLSYQWRLKKNKGNSSSLSSTKVKELSITTYLVLSIFLGYLGIHRFYRRQLIIGIIYLFTFGIFGIGWIVDMVNAVKLYKSAR